MASHVFTGTTPLVSASGPRPWLFVGSRERRVRSPDVSIGRARLGRGQRLRSRRDFDGVFRRPSVRLTRGPLRLVARPNAVGVARIGIVVAKRMIRRAVGRNRAKRVIRESFRLSPALPAMDIVVRVAMGEPAVCRADADWLFAALAKRAP